MFRSKKRGVAIKVYKRRGGHQVTVACSGFYLAGKTEDCQLCSQKLQSTVSMFKSQPELHNASHKGNIVNSVIFQDSTNYKLCYLANISSDTSVFDFLVTGVAVKSGAFLYPCH